jgi:hypothetical protein
MSCVQISLSFAPLPNPFSALQAKRKAPTRGAFVRTLSKPGSYGLMICEACDPFGTIARQVGDADAAP